MTSPCIRCANLDLKADETMVKQGFSRCKKNPPEKYVSVYRQDQCENYREEKQEVIEKRLEWRNKRELRQKNRR